jgi:transcription initiation factor IIF auxiliary subunit
MEDQFAGRQESAADRALTRDIAAQERALTRQEKESKKGELSSEQQKQVTGAQNTVNAITEFTKELESFNPRSFANLSPSARAKIQTKYRNMQLQAKEAYNLGVLNGPDLTIIEQLVADPTSMSGAAIGKEGINAQAKELKRIVSDMGNVASGKPKTVTGESMQMGMPSMSAIDAEIERRRKAR